MKLLQHLAALAPALTAVMSEQFDIPQIDKLAQMALQESFPNNHQAYTGSLGGSTVETNSTGAPVHPVSHATTATSGYWYQNIAHQGISATAPSGYNVYRNVMDYGAKGDGSTDDTAAIQQAIAAGNRCGKGCASSTTTPAVVYFPAGTYIITAPIFDYYNTMLIGDPNTMPTIKGSATFNNNNGGWMIDSDPYFTSSLNWGSTNVFFRQIRNLRFDTTAIPAAKAVSAIHWPTAQATSLQNLIFNLNSGSDTQHQGIFTEEGSAGFVGDLVFNGGNIGWATGNQQFTVRNLTFNGCKTAISHYWDWGFTYQGLSINNCQTGIDITAGGSSGQSVGSIVLLDSTISNTPVGLKTSWTTSSSPATAGSVILENVVLNNVGTAVQNNGATALGGGTTTIAGWGQGHKYTPSGPTQWSGSITPNTRPAALTSGGKYYARSKPSYNNLAASSFSSVRTAGAKGDGTTDDTTALQNVINSATSAGKVVFFDAGTYKVTKTLVIPPGAKLVGEMLTSVIMSSGSFFNNMASPQPVVQVGSTSSTSGIVEWSDMIVSTQGPQAGATLIEWNLASSSPSGMWDVHTRVGGFQGSQLQIAQCPTSQNGNKNCIGAYMHMHVTKGASNLFMENNWLWTADHDLDGGGNQQITVYSGRGLLIESTNGPTWLNGVGVEHNVFYQFQFANTKNIYGGFLQTETPYYQPVPAAPAPFTVNTALNDPNFASSCSGQSGNCAEAWGLRSLGSTGIFLYGGGFYSFFNNYSTSCSNKGGSENCQTNMVDIEGGSNFNAYCLSTIGSSNMVVKNGGTNVVAKYSDNINVFTQTIALLKL